MNPICKGYIFTPQLCESLYIDMLVKMRKKIYNADKKILPLKINLDSEDDFEEESNMKNESSR